MTISDKCIESLKSYVIQRANYGRCGAKINIIHLKMLEKAGLVIRGPFQSIDSFTNSGEKFVASLFEVN